MSFFWIAFGTLEGRQGQRPFQPGPNRQGNEWVMIVACSRKSGSPDILVKAIVPSLADSPMRFFNRLEEALGASKGQNWLSHILVA